MPMTLERTILVVGVVALTLAMATMAPAEPIQPQMIQPEPPAAITLAAELAPQQGCAPRSMVAARLADGYGEIHRFSAAGAGNTTLDLFASAASGSWTLTMTAPHGLTCLVASGQSRHPWATAAPVAPRITDA